MPFVNLYPIPYFEEKSTYYKIIGLGFDVSYSFAGGYNIADVCSILALIWFSPASLICSYLAYLVPASLFSFCMGF